MRMRVLVVAALVVPVLALAGGGVQEQAQQAVDDRGMIERIAAPFIDGVTNPTVVHAVLALLGAAFASVFVVEFLKRFAELKPFSLVFNGDKWVLKVRLMSAVVGGFLALLLVPEALGWRGNTLVAIVAAAASPTAYDIAYAVAPKLMDKLMSRVRGEAA